MSPVIPALSMISEPSTRSCSLGFQQRCAHFTNGTGTRTDGSTEITLLATPDRSVACPVWMVMPTQQLLTPAVIRSIYYCDAHPGSSVGANMKSAYQSLHAHRRCQN